MKSHLFLLSFLFCLTTASGQEQDHRGYIVEIGQEVPDFTFHFKDSTAQLSDFGDKIVLLQFTASWCGVCRNEMPHLEKEVWQEFKDKDFVLIAVDYKETKQKTWNFAKSMGISYPISTDVDGSIFHYFAEPKAGVTRNVLINKDREIVFLTRLFDPVEFESMKKEILQIVNQ